MQQKSFQLCRPNPMTTGHHSALNACACRSWNARTLCRPIL